MLRYAADVTIRVNGCHVAQSQLDLALTALNKNRNHLVKEKKGEWELLQEVG